MRSHRRFLKCRRRCRTSAWSTLLSPGFPVLVMPRVDDVSVERGNSDSLTFFVRANGRSDNSHLLPSSILCRCFVFFFGAYSCRHPHCSSIEMAHTQCALHFPQRTVLARTPSKQDFYEHVKVSSAHLNDLNWAARHVVLSPPYTEHALENLNQSSAVKHYGKLSAMYRRYALCQLPLVFFVQMDNCIPELTQSIFEIQTTFWPTIPKHVRAELWQNVGRCLPQAALALKWRTLQQSGRWGVEMTAHRSCPYIWRDIFFFFEIWSSFPIFETSTIGRCFWTFPIY